MPTPSDNAIVETLNANTSLTTNVDLFLGPPGQYGVHGVPSKAVFVYDGVGLTPEDYVQGGTHSPQYRQPVVTVRIRSDKRDWTSGQTLADTVRDALHDADFTGPLEDYHKCRVREDRASYLGEDEEGHHLFGLNVDLAIEE